MRKSILAIALVATSALAGCFQTVDQQNAAIGAVGGCVVGEIVRDGKCVEGALLGGLGGALFNDM